MEINPEYVQMTRQRLAASFEGFDSVDPRMERVPLDLRRVEKREEYLENHKKWFLARHENAISKFEDAVNLVYGTPVESKQEATETAGGTRGV